MKLLLVADLHYALPQFDWVLAEAHHFDAVVFAGDLLDVGAIATTSVQSVVIRSYIDKVGAKVPTIVCSGNHDLDRHVDGENVAGWLDDFASANVCSDGVATKVGNTLISALPWWDGPRVKAAIATQLERDAQRRAEEGADAWIWVHHAPPSETALSWNGARHVGDPDLRKWIELYQPEIVCSGHVHTAPFVPDGSWADRIGKTQCFNMGQQIGPIPAHIAIEVRAGEAFWFSFEGQELVRFARGADAPQQVERAPGWL